MCSLTILVSGLHFQKLGRIVLWMEWGHAEPFLRSHQLRTIHGKEGWGHLSFFLLQIANVAALSRQHIAASNDSGNLNSLQFHKDPAACKD